jgi:hypothetical protein
MDISLSCEYCVFSGTGLCFGWITRPEEFYRVWCVCVWSWNLDTEEAHQGLLRNEQKWITKNVQLIHLSIKKRSHIRKNTSVPFCNLLLTPQVICKSLANRGKVKFPLITSFQSVQKARIPLSTPHTFRNRSHAFFLNNCINISAPHLITL